MYLTFFTFVSLYLTRSECMNAVGSCPVSKRRLPKLSRGSPLSVKYPTHSAFFFARLPVAAPKFMLVVCAKNRNLSLGMYSTLLIEL